MSTPRFSFSHFDRVTIDGTQYQPEGGNTHIVKLRRLDGSAVIELFTHETLNELRRKSNWRFDPAWFQPAGASIEPFERAAVSLTALSAERQDYVAWLHLVCTVMQELRETGRLVLTNQSVDDHRDAIEREVNTRDISRQNLVTKPRGGTQLIIRRLPSSRTLLTYYRRYRNARFCIDPLVPRDRSPRTPTQVDYEAESLLRECMLLYASPERPSKSLVFRWTEDRFDQENARRAAENLRLLRTYSKRTVFRRIGRLDPFFVTCHRHSPDKARAMFAISGGGLAKLYPMQRTEFDDWKAYIRTWFMKLGITEHLPDEIRKKLPSGRRWICASIDAATRCVVGIRIAADPSSREAVRLLGMVVQDKSEIAKEVGAQSPWPFFGGLGTVATDSGSSFQSTDFHSAVTDLRGNLQFPPVGIPELRGTIERFFGTMSTQLMPLLSGRTFRSSDQRGNYDSEKRTVLDDEDLLRIVIMWIVDVYHNSSHAGLGGQTPAERWKQLSDERFVPEPPDRLTRRAALGVEVERILSGRGLKLFSNHYTCPELQNILLHSTKRKFRVRIDPDDIGGIAVLIDKKCHDAPAVAGDLDGVTLQDWRNAVNEISKHNRARSELSRAVRSQTISSIQASVSRRCEQLLPSSLAVTPERIKALEATTFRGKSWQSNQDPEQSTVEHDGFGTVVQPDQQPVCEDDDPQDSSGGTSAKAGPSGSKCSLEDD